MQSVPPPQDIESCTYSITCCLMESPSSWIRQFHRKKASRDPKLPGLSLGTIEWSCPGIVNETSFVNPERKIPTQRNTSEGFWSSN